MEKLLSVMDELSRLAGWEVRLAQIQVEAEALRSRIEVCHSGEEALHSRIEACRSGLDDLRSQLEALRPALVALQACCQRD